MEILFWSALIASAYSYFLYPLVLLVLWKLSRRPIALNENVALPTLSHVITVHNGEAAIEAKLANSLAVDYPADKMEIIVASDGSTDGTDDIVRACNDPRVRLVSLDQWLGKESAQLAAIREAKGDILVFSDLGTELPTEALQRLAAYFSDPDIGAVSSDDRFISDEGEVAGEGLYVRYEMALRHIESELGGLIGLSGSFFAMRHHIADRYWDTGVCGDFIAAASCVRLDQRAVAANDVFGYYRDIDDPSREYDRKLRTVLRGMASLARTPETLNPFRYGVFSLQMWSHKVFRWLVPFTLLLTLVSNGLLLSAGWVYEFLFVAQLAFYGTAIAAHKFQVLRGNPLIKIIYFFVSVNISIGHAALQFISGKRVVTWQPSARSGSSASGQNPPGSGGSGSRESKKKSARRCKQPSVSNGAMIGSVHLG